MEGAAQERDGTSPSASSLNIGSIVQPFSGYVGEVIGIDTETDPSKPYVVSFGRNAEVGQYSGKFLLRLWDERPPSQEEPTPTGIETGIRVMIDGCLGTVGKHIAERQRVTWVTSQGEIWPETLTVSPPAFPKIFKVNFDNGKSPDGVASDEYAETFLARNIIPQQDA